MATRRPDNQTISGVSGAGHTPLSGRAHIVNRDELQEEAGAGPGSLDPRTLAAPRIPEARRWLAKRGVELVVPANWKYLGIGNEGRSLTFLSETTADAHAIELHLWPLPDDVDAEKMLLAQEEQLADAVELKRVLSWSRHRFGQIPGLLVVGWGPETRDAMQATSDEDLFLATDGTGRRALSWRGVVERNDEKLMLIVALSSPIERFLDARAAFDALLEQSGAIA